MQAGERQVFGLEGTGIDLFGEWLEETGRGVGIERKNILRVRLLMEEILLRFRDNLGETTEFSASIDRVFGYPRLRIELAGAPFNPLGLSQAELGEWDSSLAAALGPFPQYSYERSHNVVRLALPVRRRNPVVRIFVAMLGGLVVGILGAAVMPDDLRVKASELLLDPLFDLWSLLLNSISGPIIFLTVITTMISAQRITRRGGSKLVVILRYFAISIALVVATLSVTLTLFPLVFVHVLSTNDLLKKVIESLAAVVPPNIVDPFMTANTAQLLVLALVLGFTLIQLEGHVDMLKALVREANTVGLKIAAGVSWLVPVVTAVFLCLELWQVRTDLLVDIWQPLGIALAISVLTMIVSLLIVARFYGFSARLIARGLRQPFTIALRTSSLDEAFGAASSSCTHKLGIDEGFVKVALPQGLVLYMPVSAIGTIVFTLFVAKQYDMQVDTLWYLNAIVMAVVVFVATPPVPGANLLAYVVLFASLGIPREALLDAMIFDVVFGIFAGAANQVMLQLEMLSQANRLGLVNRDVLRRR